MRRINIIIDNRSTRFFNVFKPNDCHDYEWFVVCFSGEKTAIIKKLDLYLYLNDANFNQKDDDIDDIENFITIAT